MMDDRPLSTKPNAIYARGYGAGIRKLEAVRQQWRKAFDRLRERTERAEKAAGHGQCMECVFWTRNDTCKWGFCDMKRAADGPTWPMPWAHVDCGKAVCQGP